MVRVFCPDLWRRGGSYWWRQAAIAAMMIAAVKVSHTMNFPGTSNGLFFPPAGLDLGVALLWGVRQTWLGMTLGAFVVDLPLMIEQYGPVQGFIVETAGCLGILIPTMLGATWLRRTSVRADLLASVAGVLRLVLVGGVLTFGVDCLWQATLFWLVGSVPGSAYGSILVTFWLEDIASVVALTSLCLAWRHPWPIERPRLVSGVVIASVFLGLAVFWLPTERSAYFEYVTVLLVVGASFLLGQRGATASATILSVVLVWATVAGRGRYAYLPVQQVLMLLNLYIISVSLTGIILAAVLQERAESAEEIQKLNQELELRVEQRTAALEQANKELEAFSYSVSHDLRAPLRHVSGYASILKEELGNTLGDQGQRYLAIVSQSAARMGSLIDNLLTFSRASRLELGMRTVDMSSLVQEVASELREEVPERRVVLTVGDLPSAVCDRALVRQVLTNLLSNAMKFSAARPVTNICVSCVVEGNEQVYSVTDNGVGFDMCSADRLFGVFQRLHRDGQFEGTGIGLAIVQRIVERHGGHVWAEGHVNQGATFYFTLPIRVHRRAGELPRSSRVVQGSEPLT